MNLFKGTSRRYFYAVGFSLPFSYLLSFLFEGQVLYSLLNHHNLNFSVYIFAAIIAHFAGLFSCGRLVRSPIAVRYIMLGSIAASFLATTPFFFAPSPLWAAGLVSGGYAGGCLMASWGYYLKHFIPKNQRMQGCADVLICSNLMMITIHMVDLHGSPFLGLALAALCLLSGIFFVLMLPVETKSTWKEMMENRRSDNVRQPLLLLCFFIFVITINSGLMYQVISPAFAHLAGLTSWYWAVPYIAAIGVMRFLPQSNGRSRYLYLGLMMIMASFIGFMLLGRGAADYLAVNTLMLGAFGIFDLFWWSILGEMLDYDENPVQVFGVGLAANVLGILCGGVLGFWATRFQLPGSEITVIALSVLFVTLLLLPPLNRQLALLLKSHVYLAAYDRLTKPQQEGILEKASPAEELTAREKEVLEHILSGKSNREIAQSLEISESTVKTHAGNVFAKYDIGSRAELISSLLKHQADIR